MACESTTHGNHYRFRLGRGAGAVHHIHIQLAGNEAKIEGDQQTFVRVSNSETEPSLTFTQLQLRCEFCQEKKGG